MMRRMFWPLVFGLGGLAILLALGFWQLDRLEWKRGILAEIEDRIAGDPAPLPLDPQPDRDRYLPVAVVGHYLPGEIHVLIGRRLVGAGYRIIAPFETESGRRVLIDRGFVRAADKSAPRPPRGETSRVTGNLHWPQERDSFTPDADLSENVWFAREVDAMARNLGTEPLLIVARDATGDGIEPLPVGTEGIPNDHLQYALTWFGIAVLWAGMTGLLLWRIRRRDT